MGRLILMRHGSAEADSATGDDFDRRLQPRGEAESAEMGRRLAELGYAPDLALVSPAARARGTWAHAGAAFPDAETRFEDVLYHADSLTLRRAAERALETHGTVMIVGHNPGLHELTLSLLREESEAAARSSRAQTMFPTATVAVFLVYPDGRIFADGLFFPGR